MEEQVAEVLPVAGQDEPSELKTLAGGLLLVNAKIELLRQQLIESLSTTIGEEVDKQLRPIVQGVRELAQSYHALQQVMLDRTSGLEKMLLDIQNQLVSLDGRFASHSALTQDSLAQLKATIDSLQKNMVVHEAEQAKTRNEQSNSLQQVNDRISVLTQEISSSSTELKQLLSSLIHITKTMSEKIGEVATKVAAPPMRDDKLGALSAKFDSLQAVLSALKNAVTQLYWSHQNSVAKFDKAIADMQKALRDIQKAQ